MGFKYLWGLIFLITLCPSFSYSWVIYLYPEIGANDSIITVGKIGKIVKEKKDNDYLDLANSPLLDLPKSSQYLTSIKIAKLLKAKYGLTVRIEGSGIRIYPLYTLILEQEIAEKIKTQLYILYPELTKGFIDIMYLKNPKFPKVPAGDLDYKILIPGGKIDLTKYVRVEVKQMGKDLVNISIPIKIIFNVPIWVSKKNLKKGSLLKPEYFNKKLKATLQLPKNLKIIQKDFRGKRISKSIKKGEILNYQYII